MIGSPLEADMEFDEIATSSMFEEKEKESKEKNFTVSLLT